MNNDNFPTSAAVPGQAESRASFAALAAREPAPDWWQSFLDLKATFPHFKNWRIYVFIAWSGQPRSTRKPDTLAKLCELVLGCSQKSTRNWRNHDYGNDASVGEAIAYTQAAPLLEYRADVFRALIDVAVKPDSSSHSDRKLYFEMVGDYERSNNKGKADDTGSEDWYSAIDGDQPTDA